MSLLSNRRGDASLDAFGRLRVTNPETLLDSKQIFDNLPLFWDDQEVSGTGTSSTFTKAKAQTVIAVDSNAGKRVRQTFERFNYQPGKGQLVVLTGVLGTGGTGITQCLGFFDDKDGLFFQCDAGTVSVVQRSSATGSAVDTAVAQSSWNLDTMDGTGPSGATLNFAFTQLFFIDFEWLGVGRVRMGFFVDGVNVVVHEFLNANIEDVVYMSTPNLPVRYSIENDGTGSAATLTHMCSSVIAEGGIEKHGVLHHQSTAGVHVDMDTENTLYAIVALRLKSTHLAMSMALINATVTLLSASDDIEWQLIHNATIAGTPTWLNRTDSSMQYFLGTTVNTVTGGLVMSGGYVSTGAGASAAASGSVEVPSSLRLGSLIDGTPETVVLCARPINGSVTDVFVEGAITWRELN